MTMAEMQVSAAMGITSTKIITTITASSTST